MLVDFNGPNLEIILTESTGVLNIKVDIYSAWKDWIRLLDNAKYPQMFRTVGGDPIDTDNNIPGYFYLMSGWRIKFPEDNISIQVAGFILVDGGADTPYLPQSGNFGIALHSVVALNKQVNPKDLWEYENRSLTDFDAAVIAEEVWTYEDDRTVTALNGTIEQSALTQDEHDRLFEIPLEAGSLTVEESNKLMSSPTAEDISSEVWSDNNRSLTNIEMDVKYVNGVAVHGIDEFKADVSNLATKTDTDLINNIVSALPGLNSFRDEMINIQFGGLDISNNQMTITDKAGTTIAIFDLFDNAGNPTMNAVYKRVNV